MSSFMLLVADEYSESTKSEEEIKQLMMNDQGSIQKNMLYIMSKGHPLQRPFVYRNFGACWKELLGYIVTSCSQQNSQNQGIISESLLQLLKNHREEIKGESIDRVFELCIYCVNRQNWNLNQKWGVVLEELLKIDHSDKKLGEIQKLIISFGKANQPIISRVTSGRLITILSCYMKKLKPPMIDILRGIISLPQEQPKLIWLQQFFPKLLKNCQFSFLQVHFQQKLLESVYDKNQDIGICALQLIMRNCEVFSKLERDNRIAKLFVDAMGSREDKTISMISKIMGEVYQKLQDSIRMKQDVNLSFWQSLMQLSQSKNSDVLNNFLFNLPGILTLSKSYYNIEPISQVYIGLFYQNLSSKSQLMCCFHQMINIFPSKKQEFKQIIYDIFEQILDEEQQDYEQIFSVADIFLTNFSKITPIFIQHNRQDKQSRLQQNIIKYLLGYWNKIQKRRNATQIENYHKSIIASIHLFSIQHLQLKLIPKFYSSLKLNLPQSELLIQTLVRCFTQLVGNLNFISGYVSKVFIQFGKSTRSFERTFALRFFTSMYKHFSMQIIKQLKIFDKLLYFADDKYFGVRYTFISIIAHVKYSLTKEQIIQYNKTISKYQSSSCSDNQQIKQYIINNKQQFELDTNEFEEHIIQNNTRRESQKILEAFFPQKRIQGRRQTSLLKQARLSLKDQTLKIYNKKKVILNEISTTALIKPVTTDLKKKKFKISTKISKKA